MTRRQRKMVHFLLYTYSYDSVKAASVEHDARELESNMLS